MKRVPTITSDSVKTWGSDEYAGQRAVIGRLFENHMVQLHPGTIQFSRSWQEEAQGVAVVDREVTPLLRIFHDLCGEYEKPFVIDVGAHVGTLTLMGAINDSILGWSFEPHPEVCEVLRSNISRNGLEQRITVFQKALFNYPGRRVLKSPHDDRASALACIGQPNFGTYREHYVDVVRLDDIAGSGSMPSVDIITIDTEGCELSALIGAAETLQTHKPDLLLKVNWATLTQFGVYANNLTDYLELLGYHGHWVGAEEMLFRHPYRKADAGRRYFTGPPDNGGLKIALVKQHYDVFGPWRSQQYDSANPMGILKKWPSKYSYLEMTHLFQADWYVVPFCHDSKIVRQKIDYHQQVLDEHMEYVRHIDELPLEEYDVVITLDPILRPPRDARTLFAYFQNEHHNSEYARSLRGPLSGYDLFLDHMMSAPAWVYDLPQPVAFPYPRNSYTVRIVCQGPKREAIWFDKRFIMMLSHGNEAFDRGGFEAAVAFLENQFRVPIAFRYLDFEDMTRWGDPYDYLQAMGACTYYVNLIACGAGQGLCDAASLGLVCFGSPKLPYHRMVCHPMCLCRDLAEFAVKFALVRDSEELRREIVAWQEMALSDRLMNQPVRMLQAATEKKLRAHPAKTDRSALQPLLTAISVDELLPETARINDVKLKALAQAAYQNGCYEEALHRCRQALWFDPSDHEIHYLASLAHYALKEMKSVGDSLERCLTLKSDFKPALTLQRVMALEPGTASEDGRYEYCRNRVLYLIYNSFSGFNPEVDGPNMDVYNSILDEVLSKYIEDGDRDNQTITFHHKMRLNRIAGI